MNKEVRSYERTHVYEADRRADPKRVFVEAAERLSAHHGDSAFRHLDIGGASGDLAHYLKEVFPGIDVTCIDYDRKLVETGEDRVPGCRFIYGDANDMTAVEDRSFDSTTFIGTMSIFDDFRPSLSESIRATADGGLVTVFGIFNDFPVDFLVYWRYSGSDGPMMPGYNHFSTKSVGDFLDSHERVANYEFRKFVMPIDIESRDDPIRSWTETGPDGERFLKNGIMPVLNMQFLFIELS
jgi:ubiquinone/menaquinone biosynthesis C-methylase UbiE